MKCHEVRQLFPLYYDSEGDAEIQFRIADHLGACDGCREWFARESRHVAALDKMLRADMVPNYEIWLRIEQQCKPRPAQRLFAWPRWPVAAAVLLSATVLMTGLVWYSFAAVEHLSAQAASFHDEYIRGGRRPALTSESVEAIEKWLRANLGFSVRCPPQGQADFRLHGADVQRFGQRAGAHILGEVNGQTVSVFVLPRESLEAFPHLRRHLTTENDSHECREGPYQMVARIMHGHVVVAVGQHTAQVLTEVLLGYGHHHHAMRPPLRVSGIRLASRSHLYGTHFKTTCGHCMARRLAPIQRFETGTSLTLSHRRLRRVRR